MSQTFTLLDSGAQTVSGATSLVSSSVSPAAGSPVSLVFVTRAQTGLNPPTVSGCGLSWALETQSPNESANSALFTFIGTGTPNSGVVTIARSASDVWDRAGYALVQIGGAGTTPIVAANNVIISNDTDVDVITLNYNQAFAAGSAGLAYCYAMGGTADIIPKTGWSELLNLDLSGDFSLEIQYILGSATFAQATLPSTGYQSILTAFEVSAPSGPAPTPATNGHSIQAGVLQGILGGIL